jgi:hypothetical protein
MQERRLGATFPIGKHMIMYETDDADRNRASAHDYRGGTVRIFKRLLPVLLVLVLLAGVAPAQFSQGNQRQLAPNPNGNGTAVANLRHNPPSPPRLYFGTVVRDTADEDAVGPGPGEIPSILQQQVPRDVPLWNSFLTWAWLSLLLVPR